MHVRPLSGSLRLPAFLPVGRPLAQAAFEARHRGLLLVLWLHVPALILFALLRGFGLAHSLLEGALVAVFAVLASFASGQQLRAGAVALGLTVSSSVLVHLWGGAIEGHFHFFVVMTFLALYQSWLPFLTALGFIILEHGVMGAIAADTVYAHAGGANSPWTWAMIHGAFVLASCIGNVLAWRLTETEALRDGLTGLPNRTLFLDRLDARFSTGREQTAVLFLDLDDFKEVNDGFGHEVGDSLLVAVAQRLSGRMRKGELLARLGGDEFAMVLSARTEQEAQATGERMLTAFATSFQIGELSISSGASAGIATTNPRSTPTSLLRDADLAMYASKRAGGGRCTTATPSMHDEAQRRSALINELPDALRNGELVVHYQPIFRLAGGDTVGVEALVRWQHPVHGLLQPAEFVPAAEQSGFIRELGLHVLRTACAQGVVWHAMFPDHLPLVMSVNVSARQLAEPDFVAVVMRALSQSGLPPDRLCLEVTETALDTNVEDVMPGLRALAALGVRLALDDFGTGYSSLAHLRQLPVNVIKVDESFVRALGHDASSRAVARVVIELAHELGLAVVAEGIETGEQQQTLQELGCDTGQGYLHAPPAPADVVTGWLVRERSGQRVPVPRESATGITWPASRRSR